jgi:hypothetical protein
MRVSSLVEGGFGEGIYKFSAWRSNFPEPAPDLAGFAGLAGFAAFLFFVDSLTTEKDVVGSIEKQFARGGGQQEACIIFKSFFEIQKWQPT